MAEELELSIMSPTGAGIEPLLEQFEAETGIHVRVRLLAWDSAWSMFVRAGLYNDGPDVSEVGTTWIGDLVGMNALRRFNAAEVASLGRGAGSARNAFFPPAWQSAVRASGGPGSAERVWAIPWLVGARLIFYRPALLEQAGIDPQHAFATNASFLETVRRLYENGVAVPWTAPTGYTHTTLLNIASWVWAAGGDFISSDGRSTAFTRPAALEGMRDYFALGRYIAPEVRPLNGLEPDEYFLAYPETLPEAAGITISGPWVFCEAQRTAQRSLNAREGSIGVTMPPGGSFVGGSNLVVWKYTRSAEAAVRLVRFLTQNSAQASFAQTVGLLPARVETLETEPFSTDPFWQTAVRGMKTGRTFPTIRLWGLVEDRLTAGFSAVWNDVLAGMDPGDALARHLVPLARRLDTLLGQE